MTKIEQKSCSKLQRRHNTDCNTEQMIKNDNLGLEACDYLHNNKPVAKLTSIG